MMADLPTEVLVGRSVVFIRHCRKFGLLLQVIVCFLDRSPYLKVFWVRIRE